MDNKEYLEIIEGLLFLSGDEGLDVNQIADVLEIDKKHATNLIDELVQHYANMKLQGITIVNYGGIFKMATNPKYHMYYQF